MKKYNFISGVILALIAFACLAPIYNPPAGGSGTTIASTSSVLKGDGAGNGVAATEGTDYTRSGYTTTVTAAGTTTLTVSSNYAQFFTGTASQTVLLPVTSTLYLGFTIFIQNNSSVQIQIRSTGGNLVFGLESGHACLVTCVLTSGTSAASWSATSIATVASVTAVESVATVAKSSADTALIVASTAQSAADAAQATANSAAAANIGSAFFDPTGGSISGAIVTGNIASVTWASAGNYDVLFTTNESDANYVVNAVSETDTPGYFAVRNKSVSGFTLRSFTPVASLVTGVLEFNQEDGVAVALKVTR